MPEITQEAFDDARERYTDWVRGLLGDPSDLLHPWRDLEPHEELARQRRIATGLGLDFDALVDTCGHPFERNRLREIEAGLITPSPRQAPPAGATQAG